MFLLHLLDFLAGILPVFVIMKLGRLLGTLFYGLDRRHGRIACANLRKAFPEYTHAQIRHITKKVFQNLVLLGCEVLILSRREPHGWRDKIFEEGYENLQKARASGKSILFLTGHTGNWELLAKLGRWAGFIESVVARDIKNKKVQSWIESIRSRYDVKVISKGQIRHIVQEFEEGRTVGALIDQDGGVRGTFSNFFGRPASTPTGIIRLGLKYGIPILPAFMRRLSDRLEYRVLIGKDLTEGLEGLTLEEKEKVILERFTLVLEKFVREDPSQWLWLHRRWKTRPQGEIPHFEKKVLLLNDGKPGHFNQVLAIANGLIAWEKKVCRIQFRSPFHRALLYGAVFFKIPSMNLLRWSLTRVSLRELPIWSPSLILACGSVSAPVAFVLKYYYGAKAVVLMKSGFSKIEKFFDLVILPVHDGSSGKENVLSLEGMPTTVCEESMKQSGENLLKNISLGGGQKIAFLVGGNSDRLFLKPSEMETAARIISGFCEKNPVEILLATSRRTPPEVEKILEQNLVEKKRVHFLWARDYPQNPIPGILHLSDIVLVTEDSFSMIMEAVHSGRSVITLRLSQKGARPVKYEATLEAFEKSGRIQRCFPRELPPLLTAFLQKNVSPKSVDNRETALATQAVLSLFDISNQVKK